MSATTFAQLWDELKTEALNVVQNMKAEFKAFEAKAVPVLEADLALVLSQVKGVAVTTAATLATAEFANLTGGQKQTITVNSILQTAIALGKPIAQQDAQMLAQQAFHGTQDAIATLAATSGK
jgi:hypothetical protein